MKNKIINIIFVISIIFGLIFIMIGSLFIFLSNNTNKHIESSDFVLGYIDEIRKTEDNYDVYVSYELDGEEFKSKINTYTSDMVEGNPINLYFDDEGKIYVSESAQVFHFVGYGFLYFGIIWVICMIPTYLVVKSILKLH